MEIKQLIEPWPFAKIVGIVGKHNTEKNTKLFVKIMIRQ